MIGLPLARLSTKKGPACTNSNVVESISAAVALLKSKAASLHQLSNMRSSMKQGTSAVTNGTLPVMQNIQLRSLIRDELVPAQLITSTIGLRPAGAKKWGTVARFLCCNSLKMCAAGNERVFAVILASGS